MWWQELLIILQPVSTSKGGRGLILYIVNVEDDRSHGDGHMHLKEIQNILGKHANIYAWILRGFFL